MSAVTRNELEEISRRCLADLFVTLADLDEPDPYDDPTESDLEEMAAWEEGWGERYCLEKEEERFQQAEREAEEEQQSRKRKREEEAVLAATAEREKEEQDRKAMLANDEREHKWEAERLAIADDVYEMLFGEPMVATAVPLVVTAVAIDSAFVHA